MKKSVAKIICQDCKNELNVGEELSDCEDCELMLCEECAEKHMNQNHFVTFRTPEELQC